MVPKGWLDYTKLGVKIAGTTIIPFKVPLKPNITFRLPEKEHFSLDQLFKLVPNLGFVIDLTKTTRYYDHRILLENGIGYRKIICEGHGHLPSNEQINRFISAVDQFAASNPDRLIGVHCTHGLNRTGYMICKFLMQRLEMTATEALDAFHSARGHLIERPTYLADLKGEAPPPTVPQGEDYVFERMPSAYNQPQPQQFRSYQPNYRQDNTRYNSQHDWRSSTQGYSNGSQRGFDYNNDRSRSYNIPAATSRPIEQTPSSYKEWRELQQTQGQNGRTAVHSSRGPSSPASSSRQTHRQSNYSHSGPERSRDRSGYRVSPMDWRVRNSPKPQRDGREYGNVEHSNSRTSNFKSQSEQDEHGSDRDRNWRRKNR
jgi:atypical dual specificity phosphatase